MASISEAAIAAADELYREVVTPPTSVPLEELGDLSFPVEPRREWTPAQTPRTGSINPHAPSSISFSPRPDGKPGTATGRSRPISALPSGSRSGTGSPARHQQHQQHHHTQEHPQSPQHPESPQQPAHQHPPVAPTTQLMVTHTPLINTQPVPFEASRAHSPSKAIPVRVLASEPSVAPPPPGIPPLPLDLPSHVRGLNPALNTGSSPSGRALGPLAIPSDRSIHLQQMGGGGGGGYAPPSYHRQFPDRVDAYLARFQMHQRIKSGFRTRSDDVRRTGEELEARMQTLSRSGSPAREEEERPGTPTGAAAATSLAGDGTAPGPRPNTAGGNTQASVSQQLPEPPGGWNRFARPTSAADRRHSPGRTAYDSTATASASGRGSPEAGGVVGSSSCATVGQGAYLPLPDSSFAGTAPFRSVPTQDGLCFERYNNKQRSADLPELQLRYLRPPGATAPLQPRLLAKVPRPAQPPQRALPNGIPASRLERLSARRKARSPPKLYQQQPPPPRTDTVLLSGASALTAGNGPPGSGLGADDYFRSSLMSAGASTGGAGPRSPKGRGGGAFTADTAASEGGALAQYLAVSTAPGSGEPLLDANFYSVLQQHFKSSVLQQTHQLRAHLNVNLPVVLGAMNCVNVTEPPGQQTMMGFGGQQTAMMGLGSGESGRGGGGSGRRG